MKRRGERPRKVGDQIQRELSQILRRELRDPRVGQVTLTTVDVSPDLAHADVYFTCLAAEHAPEAVRGLTAAAGFLRSRLARRMRMQGVPQLRFVYDETVARADRIARLLDQLPRGQR